MGIIVSTHEGDHGASDLPSYQTVRDTNKRMLERYYATGEGRFDIDRKKWQDKQERKRRRQNPRSDDEDDWSTERIRINLSCPGATRAPNFIHIIERTDSSEDGRSPSTESPGWQERPPRYPAARHPEYVREHERRRTARKHERSRETACKSELTMDELILEACGEMHSYIPHNNEHGERVIRLQCFFVSSGRLCVSEGFTYQMGCSDWDFAKSINQQYREMGQTYRGLFFRLFSPSKITFIKFVKFEFGKLKDKHKHTEVEWTVTSKRNIIPSKSKTAMMWLERRLNNRKEHLAHSRFWTGKLDDMITDNAVLKVHLFETLDINAIYYVLWISVCASVVFVIAYGAVSQNHDWSTAFSGASWVVAAVALLAAILGTKTWLGGVDVEVDELELEDDENDVEDMILETEEKILKKMDEWVPRVRG